nr:MAG TPA: hypothetical protein [Caudoviricetes sp.]
MFPYHHSKLSYWSFPRFSIDDQSMPLLGFSLRF